MRQILRTFTNATLGLKPMQFRYATETKNVFVLPKRHLINPTALTETVACINESYTTRMLAYLFRDNIKFFIDLHVAQIYQHIATNGIEVDETMHSIIIPITIEYVNVFTIQNALALGQIALYAARLNLQSDKLWEAIFAKLDGQGVYKYLNHVQVVELLEALVEQGTFVNHPLVAKLSGVVAQQRAHYQHFPKLMGIIKKTNEALQSRGSETLQIAEQLKQVTA